MKFDKRIAKLIARFPKGQLNEEEFEYLQNWAAQSKGNTQLFRKLTNADYMAHQLKSFQAIQVDPRAEWKQIQRIHRKQKNRNLFTRLCSRIMTVFKIKSE